MSHPHPPSKTPWDPPRLEDVQYTHLKVNSRSLSSPFIAHLVLVCCLSCSCFLLRALVCSPCLCKVAVLTSLAKY